MYREIPDARLPTRLICNLYGQKMLFKLKLGIPALTYMTAVIAACSCASNINLKLRCMHLREVGTIWVGAARVRGMFGLFQFSRVCVGRVRTVFFEEISERD